MTFLRFKNVFLIILILLIVATRTFAQNSYEIMYEESLIQGSVKYTVVGKYIAKFKEYEGQIVFDPQDISKDFVRLVIDSRSIQSRFETLDEIVRSRRLLDAKTYPKIIFSSHHWEKAKNGYRVQGELEMHGKKGILDFPFQLKGPKTDELGRPYLEAEGKWLINRKDFDIVWSRILDVGGVIVGNHISVDWKVRAYLKL